MPVLAFFSYTLFATLLNAWWGLGGYYEAFVGYDEAVQRLFRSIPVQVMVYLSIQMVSIYVLLFRARASVRLGALWGFFLPWLPVLSDGLPPQGGQDSTGAFGSNLLHAMLILTLHFPGRACSAWLSARFPPNRPPNNTDDPDAQENGER